MERENLNRIVIMQELQCVISSSLMDIHYAIKQSVKKITKELLKNGNLFSVCISRIYRALSDVRSII